LGEPIIAVGTELGNGAGQFLVQNIVFFVGHVSIACHCFLLLERRTARIISGSMSSAYHKKGGKCGILGVLRLIMSLVYTEIALKNARDVGNALTGLIKESEVRQTTVKAMVDTGAWTLVINEDMRSRLGLEILETRTTEVAGGAIETCAITESVTIQWKDRETDCRAAVLPNETEVLLGAFPLEGLDLTINPKREEVVGVHGDNHRLPLPKNRTITLQSISGYVATRYCSGDGSPPPRATGCFRLCWETVAAAVSKPMSLRGAW
jgi:clan AA aspartic protease